VLCPGIGPARSGGFFFQAEDGIRYLYVTGVQTCALPIWKAGADDGHRAVADLRGTERLRLDRTGLLELERRFLRDCEAIAAPEEIGRASCREREEISEVAVA